MSSPSTWRIIVAAAVVQLLLNCGSHISLAPQTAILQDIICKKYYQTHALDPDLLDRCKVEPVQSEVAYIDGWRAAFETLPAILLAVPYGALADSVGRKKVLLLAIVGLFLNDTWMRLVYWFPTLFPVYTVWLGGLWQAFGAGSATLGSLTFAMVADACPTEQRTTAFSQIKAAQLISQLIFVPLGGALIAVDPWIPMLISTAFMVVGFVATVLFIPETSPRNENSREGGETEPMIPVTELIHPSRIRKPCAGVAEIGDWVRANWRLLPIAFCFFLFYLGEAGSSNSLLLLYVSKRLGWSLSQGSYLMSLQAGVHLVSLILLIPGASLVLVRWLGLPVAVKDKCIAQASGVFLILGSGLLFLATSWVPLVGGKFLSSLGGVFALPVRSLATGLVDASQLSALYSVIEVLTYSGTLIGGPLLASAFQWGMRIGPFWTGLPFLIAGGCFALSLLAVSVVG